MGRAKRKLRALRDSCWNARKGLVTHIVCIQRPSLASTAFGLLRAVATANAGVLLRKGVAHVWVMGHQCAETKGQARLTMV